jgi:hypothetical protein
MVRDGQRGRRMARTLLAIAILFGFLVLFMWVATPGYMGPMFQTSPWYESALPILGLASYFAGLGMMVRIYRADPEPSERTWRYRDH